MRGAVTILFGHHSLMRQACRMMVKMRCVRTKRLSEARVDEGGADIFRPAQRRRTTVAIGPRYREKGETTRAAGNGGALIFELGRAALGNVVEVPLDRKAARMVLRRVAVDMPGELSADVVFLYPQRLRIK